MRILHVDSARGWRGGQNQVLLSARGMQELGHEVAIACRAGGELQARAGAAGIDTIPLPLAGDLSLRAAFALRRELRRRRVEVVQLHDPHALAAGALARAGLAGPALVATRRVDFALRGPLSRLKYRRCERVVAVSRAIEAVLLSAGLSPARLRLVHEGVPDRAPQPGGRAALRELGVPETSPVIGNAAALVDHKDHATLISAAARVLERRPEVRLVLLGEGPLRPRLEAQIQRLGLAGRVLLPGFRRDVDRLLPAFDVFCLSSHMEGLGTSLLDAMCFARPIAATAAGGIPDAIEDGVCGRLVPPRDPEALAGVLLELLQDRVAAGRLAAAARARFEERFSAPRMVRATLAVLEEARRAAAPQEPAASS